MDRRGARRRRSACCADALTRRLRARFAPQGLLHYGLGKWYPGEAMPRWAFSLYWRRDGKPMWRDAALIAREGDDAHGERGRCAALRRGDCGAASASRPSACRRPTRIRRTGCSRKASFRPMSMCSIRNCSMRRRARAWCAPSSAGSARRPATCCRCAATARPGSSEAWELRREKLFLLPGDLPVGSRLPLAVAAARRARRLSDRHAVRPDGRRAAPARPRSRRSPHEDAHRAHRARGRAARRTALRVHAVCRHAGGLSRRPRRGRSGGRASSTTAGAHRRLRAAGRSAPRCHQGDARPRRDRGEPAPGEELARGGRRSRKASTRTRARARLGAEKFMRDGRQTGTGGGSHIVVGGATPAESPFLRRPDLLKSIVLYWQRHPSLSYLFSGLFIGPTSQSPRVDEARHEALYELEIALAQVPKPGEDARPVAGRPAVPQSAGRRHRQHAPRRDLHRQAVLARLARPAGSASSNSAPSRWRRTRAWRSRSNCWCAR